MADNPSRSARPVSGAARTETSTQAPGRSRRRRVVLIDQNSIEGLALAAVLADDGYQVVRRGGEAPRGSAIVVVASNVARDVHDARRRAGAVAPVVAVLHDAVPVAFAEALAAGASGVVGADCSAAELLHTLRAAAVGKVVLPLHVARELVRRHTKGNVVVTEQEMRRLRAMQRGATTSDIARREHSSIAVIAAELHELYARIGVSGRTEALENLIACGLLRR